MPLLITLGHAQRSPHVVDLEQLEPQGERRGLQRLAGRQQLLNGDLDVPNLQRPLQPLERVFVPPDQTPGACEIRRGPVAHGSYPLHRVFTERPVQQPRGMRQRDSRVRVGRQPRPVLNEEAALVDGRQVAAVVRDPAGHGEDEQTETHSQAGPHSPHATHIGSVRRERDLPPGWAHELHSEEARAGSCFMGDLAAFEKLLLRRGLRE